MPNSPINNDAHNDGADGIEKDARLALARVPSEGDMRFVVEGDIIRFEPRHAIRHMLDPIVRAGACKAVLIGREDGAWTPIAHDDLVPALLGEAPLPNQRAWEPPAIDLDNMVSPFALEAIADHYHMRAMHGDEEACTSYFTLARSAHAQHHACRWNRPFPEACEGDVFLLLDGHALRAIGGVAALQPLFASEAVYSFEVAKSGMWQAFSYIDLMHIGR